MNKIPPIWDSHVHLFTKEMAEDPANWAKQHREAVWSACVAPPDCPSIQGWSTPEQLIRDMDEVGIERVILQGWYWETMDSCRLQNQFYAQLIQQYPDRIQAFATLLPNAEDLEDELKWIQENGFIGIGELHPQAQGFTLQDESWLNLLELIRDWNFVINFHVTDPNVAEHPGKIETPLQDYVSLASNWPDQTFILSHLGALIPLRDEFSHQFESLNNLYYDCAAVPLLYEKNVIREISERVGAERLLFGSDYPLRVFPRLQKMPEFTRSIDFVCESGLTDEQLQLVLSLNAKRLFRV